MPAASIKKHKPNSDTVPTFFMKKANLDWKSVRPLVFISKRSTDGEQTLSNKALPPYGVLKSSAAIPMTSFKLISPKFFLYFSLLKRCDGINSFKGVISEGIIF